MRKHRIRTYSPIWWAAVMLGIAAAVAYLSIPSSLEM